MIFGLNFKCMYTQTTTLKYLIYQVKIFEHRYKNIIKIFRFFFYLYEWLPNNYVYGIDILLYFLNDFFFFYGI